METKKKIEKKRRHQPTKKELEEDLSIPTPFESLSKAVVQGGAVRREIPKKYFF